MRLFDEVQARTRELSVSLQQQTATADVLKVISRSAFDLQMVLDTLTESACKLCEADAATMWRPDGDVFKVAAMFGQSPAHEAALKQVVVKPGRDTCVGRALLEGRTVHIPDAAPDPEYNAPDVLAVAGNRAMIGVPLLREGAPIGVLVLTRTVARPFTEKQIALATTFADQAVIAIENVRLFNETNGGAGAADGDERDPARDQQLADRHPAGARHRGGVRGSTVRVVRRGDLPAGRRTAPARRSSRPDPYRARRRVHPSLVRGSVNGRATLERADRARR